MKPYPEYKPTELPWLPQIPKDWEIVRNKNVLIEKKRVVGKQSSKYTLLSLTLSGIIPRDMENCKGKFPEEFDTYKVVQKGNVIFCLFDIDETPRTVGLSSYNGMITGAYDVFSITGVNPRFLYYYYLNIDNQKALKPYYTGLRKVINVPRFLELRFPLPTVEEQEQIVRYLDSMTAKINKLIRAKRQQIALLQEQKQAIINQAVTKGLNPDAEMKDSGIGWLGTIPGHWEICRCKYLFREVNVRSETGEEEHLSMSQKLGLIPDSQLDGRHLMSESYIGGKICQKDDLVLNRLKAHLGVFALASQRGVVSPDYTVLQISSQKILPRFAKELLTSASCRAELRVRVRGIVEGFWRLYTEDFYDIALPLPDIDEQRKILHFIDEATEKLERCTVSYMDDIRKLDEYKNSLVSSVVTGQIDVRNIHADDFDLADLVPEMDDDDDDESFTEESEE